MKYVFLFPDDYRRWTPQLNERKGPDVTYRPPSAPFQGNSNYTTDFQPKPLCPPRSLKPAEIAHDTGPFDDTTGYKQEYIKHALPPKYQKERQKWERNTVPLDGLSSYAKEYVKKQADKTQSCKPENNPYQSTAPMDDDTTHRVDYKKWPHERPYVHQPDQWVKPEGNFDFGTTTGIDYPRKVGSPAKPRKPVERKGAPGKFEGLPTYKNDYRKWETEGPFRPQKDSGYVPPEAPFEGQSTQKRDFIGYKAPPRQSMKPTENAVGSDQPFDDTTGYKQEYIRHAMAPRPPKEQKTWAPNPAKMDGLTNYTKDFVPKQAGKMPSCKPDQGGYQSDAPFDDKTTQKVDYQKWPTERPFQYQPDVYRKPDGTFDFNTTHNIDFTKKPIVPVQMKRPEDRKGQPGKFYDGTTHKNDFRKWSGVERFKPKQDSGYVPPQAAFEGLPTYTSDYIGHKAPVRASMRPAENAVGTGAPFEGNTMYRTEYIPKEHEPCPAAILNTGRTKYVFSDQAPDGHKFYSKMPTPPIIASPLADGSLQRGLTVA